MCGTCTLSAAPLSDDIREAVRQVRASDGVQPRQPFYLLEQDVPKAAGDAEQRQQLAKLLAEAVAAKDTAPAARTVLCQHLAKVAGEAERPLLGKLLADPATAADARIALGEAVGPPAQPEAAAVYLAGAADAKPSVRVAALSSLAAFYPRAAVPVCVKALRDPDAAVAATAVRRLARLDGGALVAELAALDAPRQALALDALAEAKVAAARDTAARLTDSPDEAVRQAAVRALGVVGDAGSVALLAQLGAADALARLNAANVDAALLKVIAAAGGQASARAVAMSAAVARGIPGLTPVLLRAAADADATVRTTALKLLGRSGEMSAYPQLVTLLGGAGGEAVEDAVRMMGRRMTDRAARLAPLLARVQGGQAPAEVHIAVLRVVAPLGGEDALAPVRAGLASADAAVRDAAVRALAAWPDPAAVPALRNVEGDEKASAVHRTLATRALDRLASSWTRYAALAYLDCGPANVAAGKEGVTLRVAAGKAWTFAEQPDGTVAYDGNEVVVEAAGLKPGRAYQLGFSWWDYDANGRVQSVWVGGQQVLAKTALPAWKGKQETAATLTVALPAAAVKDGTATIRFRREAASNAVLGEVWVTDAASSRGAGVQPVEHGRDAHATEPPVVKANAGASKKVLLVTGLEYPGHPWRQTAPALAEALAQDKRLEVSLTEDPRTLAQPTLNTYDVIVLNYQNHEVPAPEGALASLKQAVEGGKGLVLFHFACGAFIDWPTKTVAADFGVIAGRVWNPKLRGHDPRGPFRVRITDTTHPITKGFSDFDTEDELYTCLDGDAPIQVLATATSKVDHKEYPMAFTLTPGKGRTFHCVLGHDLKALNPAVNALYRRGTVWAAGLE
jgi:type 1 glutamine amidotransferase/HEAT repeat protein